MIRKRNQRLKGFHKEMMSQKQQDTARKRKFEHNRLEQWKQSESRNNRTLQQILKDAKANYQSKVKSKGKKKLNMKRMLKDLKYGGKKARMSGGVRNTRSSTNTFMKDYVASHGHTMSSVRRKKALKKARKGGS